MSRDSVLGDNWLVFLAVGVVGAFAFGKMSGGQFGDLLYVIDRALYGII